MSSIPPTLARVPTMLTTHLLRGSLARTSLDVLDMQVKLASGNRIGRPSDDPIGASSGS
jgi:flagellin-like hook-associated protein FlgL